MTEAHKAMVAFVIIPLLGVIILSVFSPGQAYPTPSNLSVMIYVLLWALIAINIIALAISWYRGRGRKI